MSLRNPGDEGFTLITPEERLIFTPDETDFESTPKFIPGIGFAYLSGAGDPKSPLNIAHSSMGIVNGRLESGFTDEYFYNLGLYNLEFVLKPGFMPKIPLLTKMKVPEFGLILEGLVDMNDDKANKEQMWKYSGDVFLWNKPQESNPYVFFVPKDPIFLSTLRFSLTSLPINIAKE